MDSFIRTDFGSFLDTEFADLFNQRARQSFLILALGFCLSPSRHTIANYLWRSGATAVKHFTRFYVFIGGPLYDKLDWLWITVITIAARFVPEHEPVRVRFDETTCKKTGRSIDGCAAFRNGAGTARQEYRTLWGLQFIIAEMLIRLKPWPDQYISVPIGLALYVRSDQALDVVYQSPSALARAMLDRVVGVVGTDRAVLSVQDGNYATKQFLRDLPGQVDVIGRLSKNSPLYARPVPRRGRGRKAKKGPRLGTPEQLALAEDDWREHQPGVEVYLLRCRWHSVMPEVDLQVVLVRRLAWRQASRKWKRDRWIQAYFTTALNLDAEQVLDEYKARWSIEITIWQARQSLGLGQDRCRRYRRIVSINAFRLIVTAAQVLFLARRLEQTEAEVSLTRYRPWYLSKQGPSLHDVTWITREHLYQCGILPKVGFWSTLAEKHRQHRGSAASNKTRAA